MKKRSVIVFSFLFLSLFLSLILSLNGVYAAACVLGQTSTTRVGGWPLAIAIDGSGNSWIANSGSSTVTKVSGSGSVLGTYSVGKYPYSIAIDSSSNVWVANGGGANSISVGGVPTSAAVDSSGNVWVTNSGSNTVTKLSPSGSVLGTYSSGGSAPFSVAVDSSGNVWVVNSGKVVKLSSSGSILGTYSVSTSSNIGSKDIAIDSSGNIWVLGSNGNVTKLSPSGSVLGTYNAGANGPLSITTDSSGNIWVVGSSIAKLSSSGSELCTNTNLSYNGNDIAVDSNGNAWVTSWINSHVTKLSSSCSYLGQYSFNGTPIAVTVDKNNNIWMGNYFGTTVTELSNSGSPLATYAVGKNPSSVVIDPSGNLWTANAGDNTTTKLGNSNCFITYTCTDTDGGLNYTTPGTVTSNNGASGTDYCINSTTLNEFYCSGTAGAKVSYSCSGVGSGYLCSNGTSGGACVLPSFYFGNSKTYLPVSYLGKGTTLPLDLDTIAQSYPYGGTFTIYERNYIKSFFGGYSETTPYKIGTFSGVTSDVNGDGFIDTKGGTWTIDNSTLHNSQVQPDPSKGYEFYYTFTNGGYSYNTGGNPVTMLVLNYSLGTCSDGIKDNGELGVDCGPVCGNTCPINQTQCASVNFCRDYNSTNLGTNTDLAGACNSDLCHVASSSWPNGQPISGATPYCQWNSSSNSCGFGYYYTYGNGTNGYTYIAGNCNTQYKPTNDTCSDGFLYQSWTASWVWNSTDNYSSLAACEATGCSASDCIVDGSIYRCDPNHVSSTCQSGSATIPCPAQVQLNFFDWRNLIVAVILIFVLYVIFEVNRKKVKRSVKGKSHKRG